jgi:glycine/D-amino acid oxidase-like deaminating enzyme
MGMYDAIVVGARCAGSPLALQLARAGWKVLLLDKDALGADSLSTHLLFPNALATLDDLGILNRLLADHELPLLEHRFHVLGREVKGGFSAVGGFERGACTTHRRAHSAPRQVSAGSATALEAEYRGRNRAGATGHAFERPAPRQEEGRRIALALAAERASELSPR